MLSFLQKIRAYFSELALLLGRYDRPGLVQAVGDQVVQFFPVIQLEREEAQLGF